MVSWCTYIADRFLRAISSFCWKADDDADAGDADDAIAIAIAMVMVMAIFRCGTT